MDVNGTLAVVTGGASGLGRGTAERLIRSGGKVVIVDLPSSQGASVAREIGATFVAADVTDGDGMADAIAQAEALGPLRAVVHCAGGGAAMRVVDKDGRPGDLATFERVVRLNLVGSFNVLRLAAAAMAKHDPIDGERGVVVMTASVAAYEGQIGQINYASAKAGIVGMTLVGARDLASKLIRVCTIAPGLFDTPLLARLPEPVRQSLGASVPNPARLGLASEYGLLAEQIIQNPMLNGETIRLDGALRMQPR